MKKSVAHLPKRTQEELAVLTGLIRKYVPSCCMIILYGNYARGKYVLWDEKIEFGVRTVYQSDYDVLVVTPKASGTKTIGLLRGPVTQSYRRAMEGRRHATPQFITESVAAINENLDQRQFFFTDIIREGILIYDDGRHTLLRPRAVSYGEVLEIAESEFGRLYPDALKLLEGVTTYFLPREDYRNSAFMVHRACDRLYSAFLLVFTNYRPENPTLSELTGMTKRFSREVATVFPLNTEFERECYDLLNRACSEKPGGRVYSVTREQLGYMLGGAERLGETVQRLCTAQMLTYAELAAQLEKEQPVIIPEVFEEPEDLLPAEN